MTTSCAVPLITLNNLMRSNQTGHPEAKRQLVLIAFVKVSMQRFTPLTHRALSKQIRNNLESFTPYDRNL